ncbi:MAG: DciA family protein [Sulfurisoma sp.]|nr:DciA family protein [Sulfurisoma sp.]
MRPRRTVRSLEDCLLADAGMARLSSHASRLARLQAILAANLPVSLARGARVANLKSGKLVIHADNGAVAAKLRQLAPRLADLVRFEAAEVNGIEIRVQGRNEKPIQAPRQAPTGIGDQAKQGLTSLERRLPEGSRLKLALAKLVERG